MLGSEFVTNSMDLWISGFYSIRTYLECCRTIDSQHHKVPLKNLQELHHAVVYMRPEKKMFLTILGIYAIKN